jgi:hypothetical protein
MERIKYLKSVVSYKFLILCIYHLDMGRDSSVGIATRYGLDGPEIESQWGARSSARVQSGPGAHKASYTMGNGFFQGVKRPGRGVDHPSPYSPFWTLVACSRVTFTFIIRTLCTYVS